MTKILVADDDSAIREMLTMMLETFNYEVLTATDGQEALEIVQNSSDRLVVLLDLFMPRLDGSEVLRKIADDATLSTYHTYILLTASHNPCPFNHNDAPFHISTLTKPFAMDELLNIVDEAAQRLTQPLPSIV